MRRLCAQVIATHAPCRGAFTLPAAALAMTLSLIGGSLALPAAALAVIHPASIVDGPANDILELDGVAMATDGSGGVVYRKEVEGTSHVFAAQFVNGAWRAPVRVDTGNTYKATQPAIAAGDGGRLLVVWVQPRNRGSQGILQYELAGASLQPGASSFGQAVPIDMNVGDPFTGDATAVEPRLAMAPSGAAYAVYRVVLDDCNSAEGSNPEEAKCRGGTNDKVVQVRVARFKYLTWSSPDAINRALQLPLPSPSPSNTPAIGIDQSGNGVVAWQEPGVDGVPRIWVRRLFGAVPGNVLPASPEQLDGRSVSSEADAPAVAVSPYGEARIAYRIQGAPGSAVKTTQMYVNSLPSTFDPHGSTLRGAAPIAGAARGDIGPPSAALDLRGEWRLAWSQGGMAEQLTGGTNATGSPLALGAGGGQAQTTINPAGGGTTAWQSPPGGPAAVEVHEDYTDGAFEQAQLAGDVPGPLEGLSLAGSGEGDALVAWIQGAPGRSEVVGAFVQAPPAPFNLVMPITWVRNGSVPITWSTAADAVAGTTYSIYIDGRPRLMGLTALATQLSLAGLGDGVHHVQVLATDASGQRTMSPINELKVDHDPPGVTVLLIAHGRGVRVRVRDAASGVDAGATRISFGDGHRAARRAVLTHLYRAGGIYLITAHVRDRVGNHATVHIRVRVR